MEIYPKCSYLLQTLKKDQEVSPACQPGQILSIFYRVFLNEQPHTTNAESNNKKFTLTESKK